MKQIIISNEIVSMMRICDAQPFLLTAEFNRLKKQILCKHAKFVRFEKIQQRVRRLNSTGGGVEFNRSIYFKVYDLEGAIFRFQIAQNLIPKSAKIEEAEFENEKHFFSIETIYTSLLALAELFDPQTLNRLLRHNFRCAEFYARNEISINDFLKKHQYPQMEMAG